MGWEGSLSPDSPQGFKSKRFRRKRVRTRENEIQRDGCICARREPRSNRPFAISVAIAGRADRVFPGLHKIDALFFSMIVLDVRGEEQEEIGRRLYSLAIFLGVIENFHRSDPAASVLWRPVELIENENRQNLPPFRHLVYVAVVEQMAVIGSGHKNVGFRRPSAANTGAKSIREACMVQVPGRGNPGSGHCV